MDDLDLFTWKEDITEPFELMLQAQQEITRWSLLLNATGGALKPEKYFWYLLDYTCIEGKWAFAVHLDFELSVTNPDGSRSSIRQEEVSTSKKTQGIYNAPSGGNQGHLEYIHGKLTMWIARMQNGHLPNHMAWTAYKLQLWPGLCYGLGTMMNDLKATESIFDKADYEMMPILGVACTVKRELRKLHTTWRFWSISSPHGAPNLPTQYAAPALPHFHSP